MVCESCLELKGGAKHEVIAMYLLKKGMVLIFLIKLTCYRIQKRI